MYTVACPDPDPNPSDWGQLPNPNKCNSTLTSGARVGAARGGTLNVEVIGMLVENLFGKP